VTPNTPRPKQQRLGKYLKACSTRDIQKKPTGQQQGPHAMWLPALPEFSGSDTDDLESIIKDCKGTFPPSFVEKKKKSQKVRAASRNLRGDFAEWWAKYSGLAIA
jgi:hypothetical protein